MFGFSFRFGTHIGQIINKEALKNYSLFLNEGHNSIKENGLGKNNIFNVWRDQRVNLDENPIFLTWFLIKPLQKEEKKQY